MQEALESALAELTLSSNGLDVTDARAVDAFLARHGVAAEDAEALRQGGLERLLIYRKLVRGNFRDALEATIPRTIARLGAVFDEYFAAFLSEMPPESRYLRDLTPNFLNYCLPRFEHDSRVPAYLSALARHEALQIDIGAMPGRPRGHVVEEVALDAPVAFIAAVRVVTYQFCVHRLSADVSDRSLPEAKLVSLLVYRSPEHEVRYLELTPLAAAILRKLIEDRKNLGDAVKEACNEGNFLLDEGVLTGTSTLLADLAERGALLGRQSLVDPIILNSESKL